MGGYQIYEEVEGEGGGRVKILKYGIKRFLEMSDLESQRF